MELETDDVQLWNREKKLFMGLLPRVEAERLVREGYATIINGQAIQFNSSE